MQNVLSVKIERMYFLEGDSPTKAFCDLLIFDSFLAKGLRIVSGKEGLFVSMPTEQSKDGKWYETFYPASREIRTQLEKYILDEYKEKADERSKKS